VHSRNRHIGWDERIIEGFISFLDRFGGKANSEEPRKKFLGYNDLLDLLKDMQCPVCSILKRSINHYVATAFIEEVANGEFREGMRSSLGYCRRHSVFVQNIVPRRLHGMGVAIVYEDLVEQVRVNLTKDPFENILEQNHCALCSFESELSDYAFRLIADYCNDPEFQNTYEKSRGLCFPHMRSLCERLDGNALKFILYEHERKLSILSTHLVEFQRKSTSQFSSEHITQEEARSWQMAARFMAGDMG